MKNEINIMIFSARLGHAYAREVAHGVGRFARQRPRWHVAPYFPAQNPRGAPEHMIWEGHGAIVHHIPDWLEFGPDTRVVSFGSRASQDTRSEVNIKTNDQAIGRLAADHLVELGFQHFVYFGEMKERQKGFVDRLVEIGFPSPDPIPKEMFLKYKEEWIQTSPLLRDWIRDLPKPVGVFAQSDIQARRIAWAARAAGVSVPDELALLGVDNDEMLCELCTPPLSSVEQPLHLLGYRAAEALDLLLQGESNPETDIELLPLGIVTRDSTGSPAHADPLLREALTFLRTHLQEDLLIETIAESIGTSRRTLERAFRKSLGRTILEELTRFRIQQACESLRSTSWTLDRVAENSGFRSLRQFHEAFQKKMGTTPSRYRSGLRLK
jgi:LacI family transcriptional regulator